MTQIYDIMSTQRPGTPIYQIGEAERCARDTPTHNEGQIVSNNNMQTQQHVAEFMYPEHCAIVC